MGQDPFGGLYHQNKKPGFLRLGGALVCLVLLCMILDL